MQYHVNGFRPGDPDILPAAPGHRRVGDPLPATVHLQAKLVSQGAVDNPHLVLVLHVNEQGRLTQASFSGIECRG